MLKGNKLLAVCVLTEFIHVMYAETRVKTVGFLRVLHPMPDTKLATPWTYQ